MYPPEESSFSFQFCHGDNDFTQCMFKRDHPFSTYAKFSWTFLVSWYAHTFEHFSVKINTRTSGKKYFRVFNTKSNFSMSHNILIIIEILYTKSANISQKVGHLWCEDKFHYIDIQSLIPSLKIWSFAQFAKNSSYSRNFWEFFFAIQPRQ